MGKLGRGVRIEPLTLRDDGSIQTPRPNVDSYGWDTEIHQAKMQSILTALLRASAAGAISYLERELISK